MQLPPIPRSVFTSGAGFIAALCGWIAVSPGVHPIVATICGFLSAGATGAGLHFAADQRALEKTATGVARVCATCGRSAEPPPPPSETSLS